MIIVVVFFWFRDNQLELSRKIAVSRRAPYFQYSFQEGTAKDVPIPNFPTLDQNQTLTVQRA